MLPHRVDWSFSTGVHRLIKVSAFEQAVLALTMRAIEATQRRYKYRRTYTIEDKTLQALDRLNDAKMLPNARLPASCKTLPIDLQALSYSEDAQGNQRLYAPKQLNAQELLNEIDTFTYSIMHSNK